MSRQRVSKPPAAAVLFSGGLDSLAALLWAKREYRDVVAVTIRYGQLAEAREVRRARALCRRLGVKHRVLRTEGLTGALVAAPGSVIPRNPVIHARGLVFASLAVAATRTSVVVEGGGVVLPGPGFPDNQAAYYRAASRALTAALGWPCKVVAPLYDLTKEQVILGALELHAEFPKLLKLTTTCYRGTDCGECKACRCRDKALRAVGMGTFATRKRA